MIDEHGFYRLKTEEVLDALKRIAKLAREAAPWTCDKGLKCIDEIRSISITLIDKESDNGILRTR